MTQKKKPVLRFKGFTDDWEQRKYSNVINLISGQDFEPSQYNENKEGIPYLTGASCIENGHTVAVRWTQTPRCIAEKGDTVLVCKGSGYGTIAVVDQEKAHIARQFMAVKAIDGEIDKAFNYYLLYSVIESIKKDARGLIAGIARDAVLNQPVLIPNIDEQVKIAHSLTNLDNLITLHQRKYNKLQNLKKYFLEKMFPQNGKRVPEIRFAGFTDDWEQRKIGDCFTERKESMPKGELLSVTINEGIKRFSELERHDSSNQDKSKYKKVCIGDIAYNSMRMWQGASGFSDYEGIVSPAYTVLKPHDGIDARFVSYLFKTKDLIHVFQINSQGITSDNWNLKFPVLSTINIKIPEKIEEQNKIAEFLAKLDNLITLHQRKLEKLQNLKKAALDKMFV